MFTTNSTPSTSGHKRFRMLTFAVLSCVSLSLVATTSVTVELDAVADAKTVEDGKHMQLTGTSSWEVLQAGSVCKDSGAVLPLEGFSTWNECSSMCDVNGGCTSVIFGIDEPACEDGEASLCKCQLIVGSCTYKADKSYNVYERTKGCQGILPPNKISFNPTSTFTGESLQKGLVLQGLTSDEAFAKGEEWSLSVMADSAEMSKRTFALMFQNQELMRFDVKPNYAGRVTVSTKLNIPAGISKGDLLLKFVSAGVPGSVKLSDFYLAPGDATKAMAECLSHVVRGPNAAAIGRAVGEMTTAKANAASLKELSRAELLEQANRDSSTIYKDIGTEETLRGARDKVITGDLESTAALTAQTYATAGDWKARLAALAVSLVNEKARRVSEVAKATATLTTAHKHWASSLKAEELARLNSQKAINEDLAKKAQVLLAKLTGVDEAAKKRMAEVLSDANKEISKVMARTGLSLKEKQQLINEIKAKTAIDVAELAKLASETAAEEHRRAEDGAALVQRLHDGEQSLTSALLAEREARRDAAKTEAEALAKAYKDAQGKISAEELAGKAGADEIQQHLAAKTKSLQGSLTELSDVAKAKIHELMTRANEGIADVMKRTDLSLKEKQDAIDKIQKEANDLLKNIARVDKETSVLMDAEEKERMTSYLKQMNVTKDGFAGCEKLMMEERRSREKQMNETMGAAMQKVNAFVERVDTEFKTHFSKVEVELTADKLARANSTEDLQVMLDKSRTNFVGRLGDVSKETKEKIDVLMRMANDKIAKIMADETLTLEQQQAAIAKIHAASLANVSEVAKVSAMVDTEVHERQLKMTMVDRDEHSGVTGVVDAMRAEAQLRERARRVMQAKMASEMNGIAEALTAEELKSAADSGQLTAHLQEKYASLFSHVGGFDMSTQLKEITMSTTNKLKDVMANTNLNDDDRKSQIDAIHRTATQAIQAAASAARAVKAESTSLLQDTKNLDTSLAEDSEAFDVSVLAEARLRKVSWNSLKGRLDDDYATLKSGLDMETLTAAAASGNLSKTLAAASTKYLAQIGATSEEGKKQMAKVLQESTSRIHDVMARSTLDNDAKQRLIEDIHTETTQNMRAVARERVVANDAVIAEQKARKEAAIRLAAQTAGSVSGLTALVDAEAAAKADVNASLDLQLDPKVREYVEATEGNFAVQFSKMKDSLGVTNLEGAGSRKALREQLDAAGDAFVQGLNITNVDMAKDYAGAVASSSSKIEDIMSQEGLRFQEKQDMIDEVHKETEIVMERIATARMALRAERKARGAAVKGFGQEMTSSMSAFVEACTTDSMRVKDMVNQYNAGLAEKYAKLTEDFDARHYLAMQKLNISLAELLRDESSMTKSIRLVRDSVSADLVEAKKNDDSSITAASQFALLQGSKLATAAMRTEAELANFELAEANAKAGADGEIGGARAEEAALNDEVANSAMSVEERAAAQVVRRKKLEGEVSHSMLAFKNSMSADSLISAAEMGNLEEHMASVRHEFMKGLNHADGDTKDAVERIVDESSAKMRAVMEDSTLSLAQKQMQLDALHEEMEAAVRSQRQFAIVAQDLTKGTERTDKDATKLEGELSGEALLRRQGLLDLENGHSERTSNFVRKVEDEVRGRAEANLTKHMNDLAAVSGELEGSLQMAAGTMGSLDKEQVVLTESTGKLKEQVEAANSETQLYMIVAIALFALTLLGGFGAVGYVAYKQLAAVTFDASSQQLLRPGAAPGAEGSAGQQGAVEQS